MKLQLRLSILVKCFFWILISARISAPAASYSESPPTAFEGTWSWAGNSNSEKSSLEISGAGPENISFRISGHSGGVSDSVTGIATLKGDKSFVGHIGGGCTISIAPQRAKLNVRTDNCLKIINRAITFDGTYVREVNEVTRAQKPPIHNETGEVPFVDTTSRSSEYDPNFYPQQLPNTFTRSTLDKTPKTEIAIPVQPYQRTEQSNQPLQTQPINYRSQRSNDDNNPILIFIAGLVIIYLVLVVNWANKGELLIFSSGTDLMLSFLVPLTTIFAVEQDWGIYLFLLSFAGSAYYCIRINGSLGLGLMTAPARVFLSVLFPTLVLTLFASMGNATKDGRTRTGYSKPSMLPIMFIAGAIYFLYELVVTKPIAAHACEREESKDNSNNQSQKQWQNSREDTSNKESQAYSDKSKNKEPCPYETLGVRRGASADEIKSAFKEKMQTNHPDRVAMLDPALQQLAHERTILIQAAYEKLLSSKGAAAY